MDEDVQTPLLDAIKDMHEGVVQRIMERLDIDANTIDEDGQMPLSWAGDHGYKGVVNKLLELVDVDRNTADKDSQTQPFSTAYNSHEWF